MKRRSFIQRAALAVAGLTTGFTENNNGLLKEGAVGTGKIYYAVHGHPKGKPLFLGFPIFASYSQIFPQQAGVLNGFLDRLTDRYRVLVADYPSIGRSGMTPANELTADRACADMLAVADDAGFKEFAWWGYA